MPAAVQFVNYNVSHPARSLSQQKKCWLRVFAVLQALTQLICMLLPCPRRSTWGNSQQNPSKNTTEDLPIAQGGLHGSGKQQSALGSAAQQATSASAAALSNMVDLVTKQAHSISPQMTVSWGCGHKNKYISSCYNIEAS